MGNLNITHLWCIIAYASACQRMLSISIAFLTYEGLTCNVLVTYAERMPGVFGASMKFIDFMASNISGRFIRDFIKKIFGESYHPYHLHAHPCLYLSIQSTIMNVALVQTLLFSLDMVQKIYCNRMSSSFP